jgi:hypothetical protein
MASNDIELFQSFCRKFFNRTVIEHFKDVTNDDPDTLSRSVPRQLIKRICLHKDKDPMILTVGRLLIWWVEARGLLDEFIYGIPSANFHETVRFQPQVKLFWRESTKEAAVDNRYPARAAYTIRFKGDVSNRADILALRRKVELIFGGSTPHSFTKGREKYSYRDKEKGYEFIITAQNEVEAKSVINALLDIQGDKPLKEELLTRSTSERNWNAIQTVRVNGQAYTKPKQRPVAKVRFTHAELAVHGMAKDITLVSVVPTKVPTRLI